MNVVCILVPGQHQLDISRNESCVTLNVCRDALAYSPAGIREASRSRSKGKLARRAKGDSKGIIQSYTQTYSEKGLAQSRMWPAGTLCITIAANIAETGILAFDACFPDSVVGFCAGLEVVTEYVQGWLGFLQPLIEDRAPQVAQKNINLQILRELELPVPPIKLQKKYSDFVKLLREQIEKSEEHKKYIDNLFTCLLHRAFRGEL
jgi:type I restriction enzyme, S subunit